MVAVDSASSNDPVIRFILFVPSIVHSPMLLASSGEYGVGRGIRVIPETGDRLLTSSLLPGRIFLLPHPAIRWCFHPESLVLRPPSCRRHARSIRLLCSSTPTPARTSPDPPITEATFVAHKYSNSLASQVIATNEDSGERQRSYIDITVYCGLGS